MKPLAILPSTATLPPWGPSDQELDMHKVEIRGEMNVEIVSEEIEDKDVDEDELDIGMN